MMRGGRDRAQRNLYVLNLPLDATTYQFEALFGQYGKVEHAVILATLDHLARRRGFILMSDPYQAKLAIENLDGHVWHHYRIEVSFAIVQRIGTPFSQEISEATSDDKLPQVMSQVTSTAGSGQTREDGETPETYLPSNRPACHHVNQSKDDSTLFIAGLDTDVISSLAMVRALVEPFGHVAELVHPQGIFQPGSNGEAVAVYCCSSSASLARLALHGLIIGKSRVRAIQAHQDFRSLGEFRRMDDYDAVSSALYMTEASEVLPDRYGPLQPRDGLACVGMPTDPESSHAYSVASQRGAIRVPTQTFASAYVAPEPWQTSYHVSAETSDPRDAGNAERKNQTTLPRPIGDERHRAATKKPD